MQKTGPTVYSTYPRRPERLTICRYDYKGSTFSSVILRPWVLVRSGARTLDLPHSSLALYQHVVELVLVRNNHESYLATVPSPCPSVKLGHKAGYKIIQQKKVYLLPWYIFTSLDSSQSPGEFEKELELLTSLTVKEANHNPLLNNAMTNQGTCQFCKNK